MYYLRSYAVIFILALVGSTPLPKKLLSGIQQRASGEKILNLVEPVALVGLLLVMTGYLVDGSFSPFLYFRF
jgi:alginate O-acetyltransferase complex protein AlgI